MLLKRLTLCRFTYFSGHVLPHKGPALCRPCG